MRTKKALNVYIDPDLSDRFDAWIASQELRPNKTALVELALRRLLDSLEPKKEDTRNAPAPSRRTA